MTPSRSRRREILEHATRRAARDGLDGVSIGLLAGDLQMSKSGLFSHFDSKEGLKLAVLDFAAERFAEYAIRPALSEPRGEPRLRALFDNWLDWQENNPFGSGCLFVAAAAELDDRQGPSRERLVALERDFFDIITNVVQTGITEGHYDPETDPQQVAHEVRAIFFGHHHVSRLLNDPDAGERARATFERLMRDLRRPS